MTPTEWLTRREATNQGVDPDFAAAIVKQETGHLQGPRRLNARSPKGAIGPMQLMPETAKSLGVDPHDVIQNIQGGVKYLKQQQDEFGDQKLAAAAYNAGPSAVRKYKGVPPYKETQNYVAKVAPNAPESNEMSGKIANFLSKRKPAEVSDEEAMRQAYNTLAPAVGALQKAHGVMRQGASALQAQQRKQSPLSGATVSGEAKPANRMPYAIRPIAEAISGAGETIGQTLSGLGSGAMAGAMGPMGPDAITTDMLTRGGQKLAGGATTLGETGGMDAGIAKDVIHGAGALAPVVMLPGGIPAIAAQSGIQSLGAGSSPGEALKHGLVTGATLGAAGKLAGPLSKVIGKVLPEGLANYAGRSAAFTAAPLAGQALEGHPITGKDVQQAAIFGPMFAAAHPAAERPVEQFLKRKYAETPVEAAATPEPSVIAPEPVKAAPEAPVAQGRAPEPRIEPPIPATGRVEPGPAGAQGFYDANGQWVVGKGAPEPVTKAAEPVPQPPTRPVETAPEGHTRFYRADRVEATGPQGINWVTDPEYASKKHGAGQMGSESMWYIDVPTKELQAEFGDVPSGLVNKHLEAMGLTPKAKLYRRVEAAQPPISETPMAERSGEIVSQEPARVTGVEGAVSRARQGERRAQEEGARDNLTGLQNQNQWEAARDRVNADPNLHVSRLDVNKLKGTNDTFGHDEGDKYVAQVGKIIGEEAAKAGVSDRSQFRSGGDEFTLVGSEANLKAATEAIQRRIAAEVNLPDGTKGSIAGGIGANDLIADKAMYADKEKAHASDLHPDIQADAAKIDSILDDPEKHREWLTISDKLAAGDFSDETVKRFQRASKEAGLSDITTQAILDHAKGNLAAEEATAAGIETSKPSPQETPQRETSQPQGNVNPDDFLNFRKLNVSDAEKENLRRIVGETVTTTGGDPKQRVTFEDIRREARDLDPKILDNLKRPSEGETLNPVVRLAARQRLNTVNAEAVRLQTELANERGKANPSLERVGDLAEKVEQFESDAKGLIDVLYPTRSQDGRNLAFHRLMADATWDVDHWVGKARGIAERRGQNIFSDDFQGMQRQIQEVLARGKAAETREAELKARIAELEKATPEPVSKAVTKMAKVTGGGWQSRFTQKLDTLETAARQRIKDRGKAIEPTNGERGAAPIIDDINDLVIIGAAKIAKKGVNLATWANDMATEFGDSFTQHRKEIYRRAFKMYKEERASALDETRVQRLMKGGVNEAEARRLMTEAADAAKERSQSRQELARVFARIDKPSKLQRGVDYANAPRALLASLDLSAPLRQGAILSLPPTQWKIAAKSSIDMIRSLSTKQYEQFTQALHADPVMKQAKKAKLFLSTRADGDFASLVQREEAFMSNLAEKIPGVKRSEQAYVTYLDSLRTQTFKKFLKGNPNATPEQLADVAKFINYATGRGDLGKMGNAIAPALNAVFFSPRYLASRVQLTNPKLYNPRTPQGRMAISNMMQFTGVVATALGLAKMNGADVDFDPDSPDFLKIKVGNTRYDILAGFQQPIRFAWRLAKGMTNNARGIKNERNNEPLVVTERFLRSKASPLGGVIGDVAFGKTFEGKPVSEAYNPTDLKAMGDLALDKLAPMVLSDAWKAWQDSEQQGQPGWKGTAKSTPAAFFGIGTQTYSAKPKSGSSPYGGSNASPYARK